MQLNPDTYALDCENYRLENGGRSLFTYLYRQDWRLYVVKKEAPAKVTLIGVLHESEITVTPEQFASNFDMHIQDETVFFFGTKEQQESASKLFEAESSAVKQCVYGSNQLPVVVSATKENRNV